MSISRGRFVQGKFRPAYPKKYEGDLSNIVFRSSWELALCKWLDENDNVVRWNSEETIIPYVSAVDGKRHRYFLDFTIYVRTPRGLEKKFIEVKPEAQTKKPKKRPTEKDEAYAERVRTYIVNQCKWKAAVAYAKEHGGDFIIITEKHLFPANERMKPYKKSKK